jgi:hypothetical protein
MYSLHISRNTYSSISDISLRIIISERSSSDAISLPQVRSDLPTLSGPIDKILFTRSGYTLTNQKGSLS